MKDLNQICSIVANYLVTDKGITADTVTGKQAFQACRDLNIGYDYSDHISLNLVRDHMRGIESYSKVSNW